MNSLRTDVLVVGGGPAGATAAFQLAGAGVGVILIDRATFPRDKTCGESLSPGALARLKSIGMWPPRCERDSGDAPPPATPVRGMRIRSPRGTTFVGRYRAGPNGSGLAIRRNRFDAELLASARAQGARVMEGIEATSGEPTPGGDAVVHARATGGRARLRIETKRVVVADGRQSYLARELGFIGKNSSGAGERRFAVRAHFEGVDGLSDLAEMHVGDGGYCGVAPLSKTSANICYVLFRSRLDIRPQTIEADFRRHVHGFPEVAHRLASARSLGKISVIGPLRLTSSRQVRGPFIACGDTTGFLDPFTGEGIAHAISAGVLGAEAIRASLQGDERLFAGYERQIHSLRRIKRVAASVLFSLVARKSLANAAASAFALSPRFADAVVQLFGDQI